MNTPNFDCIEANWPGRDPALLGSKIGDQNFSPGMKGGLLTQSDFDFCLTEGQSRRGLLTGCNSYCTQIFDYLFVGGWEIASSRRTLEEHGITRIVNCCASIVDNFFLDEPGMTYLSLRMVDGRQDDISWFLGDVFHFILSGIAAGEKILLHCERGVSRSCSFAIAYHMWISGSSWTDSFDFVKSKRICCAPNTAFTCNLIEINECLRSDFKRQNVVLYRLASHLIPDDPNSVVLKMCRNKHTRKFINAKTSVLDPRGVYVLKIADHATKPSPNNKNGLIRCHSKHYIHETGCIEDLELDSVHPLYVWKGSKASSNACATAVKLAQKLLGVFTSATHVECVQMGQEPDRFLENILQDGVFSKTEDHAEWYNDLFTGYSPEEPSPVDKSFSVSHDSYSRSYYHPGIFSKSPIWTPITTTINTLASKSTGSTGVEGLDSCDTKYLNGELAEAQTPSIRSRSDSEDSSVDMFYDYSNSSDDDSEYSSTPHWKSHRLRNRSKLEQETITYDSTLFSDDEAKLDSYRSCDECGDRAEFDPTCPYIFDNSDRSDSSNLGSGATDRDFPLTNTPCEYLSPRRRLPPLVKPSNAIVLKRISSAASKYGISLNLNLGATRLPALQGYTPFHPLRQIDKHVKDGDRPRETGVTN